MATKMIPQFDNIKKLIAKLGPEDGKGRDWIITNAIMPVILFVAGYAFELRNGRTPMFMPMPLVFACCMFVCNRTRVVYNVMSCNGKNYEFIKTCLLMLLCMYVSELMSNEKTKEEMLIRIPKDTCMHAVLSDIFFKHVIISAAYCVQMMQSTSHLAVFMQICHTYMTSNSWCCVVKDKQQQRIVITCAIMVWFWLGGEVATVIALVMPIVWYFCLVWIFDGAVDKYDGVGVYAIGACMPRTCDFFRCARVNCLIWMLVALAMWFIRGYAINSEFNLIKNMLYSLSPATQGAAMAWMCLYRFCIGICGVIYNVIMPCIWYVVCCCVAALEYAAVVCVDAFQYVN